MKRWFARLSLSIAAAGVTLGLCSVSVSVYAFSGNARSADELTYGAVLFEYHQRNHFGGLIEQRYAESVGNRPSLEPSAQLLAGSMMLSYGLADRATSVFDALLEGNVSGVTANRAWYYLAKLHHSKGDTESARFALAQIQGRLPVDVLVEYHYLASLLAADQGSLADNVIQLEREARSSPVFNYFLFNQAVLALHQGAVDKAVRNLEQITSRASGRDGADAALVDRARHGLAELAMQTGELDAAWAYLKDIRTSGLYSNRALLSYAWAGIERDQPEQAIPALELLAGRSIAIPEVQEAKVLLAHVYEQRGELNRALAQNIDAEAAFHRGLDAIDGAREVIATQEVPREFIANLEAMMADSDWLHRTPSLDHQRLTPFLLDLMASHAFTESLNELADLYVIEDNLRHWSNQAEQHLAILDAADAKSFSDERAELIARAREAREALDRQKRELRLYALTLEESEHERIDTVIAQVERELSRLNERVDRLSGVEQAYEQPEYFRPTVNRKHQDLQRLKARTSDLILELESVLRQLINSELDKHEQRMRYYAAQSRLAKARLYDLALMSLEGGARASESAE